MASAIDDSGGGEGRGKGHHDLLNESLYETNNDGFLQNTDAKEKTIAGIERIYGSTKSSKLPVVEIPFWLHRDRPPKWISGINRSTTCRDILLSLVKSAASKPPPLNAGGIPAQNLLYTEADVYDGKLVLVEEWRGVVKPLRLVNQ